jgi:hypothetical protein
LDQNQHDYALWLGRDRASAIDAVPHGQWNTSTLITGPRRDGLVALCVFDGAINGEALLAYVEQCYSHVLGLTPDVPPRRRRPIVRVRYHRASKREEPTSGTMAAIGSDASVLNSAACMSTIAGPFPWPLRTRTQ